MHLIRGSRSLLAVGILTLLLSLVEPALPANATHLPWTLPLFLLLIVGVATLPREGVAVRQRALALASDERGDRKLWRHLWWPLTLCVLLLPRLFLGAYGIPHMSPLTGLLLPTMQRRIALAFLAIVVIVPVLSLRRTRRYDPSVATRRPRDLRTQPELGSTRDGLLLCVMAITLIWLLLLRNFWQPFSPLDWPPTLDSLAAGSRGVTAVAFALIIPLVLFLSIQGHAGLVRAVWRAPTTPLRSRILGFTSLHLLLDGLAVALHAYNLLWIVRYQAATGF